MGKGALAPCPPLFAATHASYRSGGHSAKDAPLPTLRSQDRFHYRPPLCSANDISQHFKEMELAEQ